MSRCSMMLLLIQAACCAENISRYSCRHRGVPGPAHLVYEGVDAVSPLLLHSAVADVPLLVCTVEHPESAHACRCSRAAGKCSSVSWLQTMHLEPWLQTVTGLSALVG